jgi:hypothetical protein
LPRQIVEERALQNQKVVTKMNISSFGDGAPLKEDA